MPERRLTADWSRTRTLCWVEAGARTVGAYRRAYFGFLPSPFASGEAVVFTYRLWLIDKPAARVLAHAEFTGPDPPSSQADFHIHEGVRVLYGVPPDDEAVRWIMAHAAP